MTAATAVTLATGRTLDVKGTYEDLRALLAARTLGADDGWREVRDVDGRRHAFQRTAVAHYEEIAQAATKRAVGFR